MMEDFYVLAVQSLQLVAKGWPTAHQVIRERFCDEMA